MKSLNRLFCCFIIYMALLLSLFSPLHAHPGDSPFKLTLFKDTEPLFPSSNAYCLFQDRKGILWIGTSEGLLAYNGYSFQQYQHDPKDSKSISANFVFSICEGTDGKLWIGTSNGGLNCFDPILKKFSQPFANSMPYALDKSMKIRKVMFDKVGNLWIKSDKGVFLIDLDRFSVRKLELPNLPDSILERDDSIGTLYPDKNGDIWIGAQSTFRRFSSQTLTFKNYFLTPLSHKSTPAFSHNLLSHQTIFASNSGLQVYDKDQDRLVPFKSWSNSSVLDIDSQVILKALYDRNGNLWIASSKGIYLQQKSSTTLQQVADFSDPARPRPNQRIYDILEDLSGVLWFATIGDGLIKIDPSITRFGHYYPTEAPDSLSDKLVWSFAENHDGKIWVGTQTGLELFTPVSGSFERVLPFPSSSTKSGSRFMAILPLNQTELLVGLEEGLLKLDINTRKSHFIDFTSKSKSSFNVQNRVYDLHKDQLGRIWFGSHGGLHQLKSISKSNTYLSKEINPELKRSISVYKIKNGKNHTLWLASLNSGLIHFNPDNGLYTVYKKIEDNKKSLSHDVVMGFTEAPSGVFWVATLGGGLNRLDTRGQTPDYQCFTTKDGLADNNLLGICSDSKQNLWLSSVRGLTKFNPSDLSVVNYSAKDGLQSNEFSGGSFKDSSGFLYFGGVNGFNRFNPEQIVPNPHMPQLALTSLSIMSQEYLPKDVALSDLSRLRLNYRQYLVEFQFSALDFTAPEKNRYAYRFKGRDEKWIELGTRRDLSFNHLESGIYHLEVRGSNNDGIWSPHLFNLELTIEPPPWRTWWAYGIYAVLALSISLWYTHWKSKSMRMALEREREFKEELDRQVKARTRELEQANLELVQAQKQLVAQEKNASMGKLTKGIAHEIRNPLNFINNFALVAQDLAKELQETLMMFLRKPSNELAESADHLIEELKENSQLIEKQGSKAANIVSMLLEHSRSMGGELQYINLNNFVTEYVPLAIQSLDNSNRYLPVELDIRLDPKVRNIHMFSNDMARVFLNLLDNCYYALVAKSKAAPKNWAPTITVSTYELGPDLVGLSIRDNGTGIDHEVQAHVFVPLFTTKAAGEGTGLGLSITREIIQDVHGGTIELRSEPGQFTEVEIRLPRTSTAPPEFEEDEPEPRANQSN